MPHKEVPLAKANTPLYNPTRLLMPALPCFYPPLLLHLYTLPTSHSPFSPIYILSFLSLCFPSLPSIKPHTPASSVSLPPFPPVVAGELRQVTPKLRAIPLQCCTARRNTQRSINTCSSSLEIMLLPLLPFSVVLLLIWTDSRILLLCFTVYNAYVTPSTSIHQTARPKHDLHVNASCHPFDSPHFISYCFTHCCVSCLLLQFSTPIQPDLDTTTSSIH